ncbi:MAG: hypothetical protein AVDCRST_MAG74-211, partial [uncultured Pyrinomonadaceae bacterium]
ERTAPPASFDRRAPVFANAFGAEFDFGGHHFVRGIAAI